MAGKLKILFSAIKVLLTDWKLTSSLTANFFFFIQLRFEKNSNREIIALSEHLGDIIAAEPISRHLKEKNPGAEIIWIVNTKYGEILFDNPSISKIRTVSCFTEWILLKRFISKKYLYDFHISGKVCEKHGFQLINPNTAGISLENYFDKGNLLYSFSKTAGIDMDTTVAPKLYFPLTRDDFIPGLGKTVVLHTSANSTGKSWNTECWNKLVKDIDEHFNPDKIIETGFSSCITINHPKLINYCGEQSLASIRFTIDHCSLFIGVESGFAHIANALEKNSIILTGRLNHFENYMPYSGTFMKEAANTILHFNKPLLQVSYDEFKPRFLSLLQLKKENQQ